MKRQTTRKNYTPPVKRRASDARKKKETRFETDTSFRLKMSGRRARINRRAADQINASPRARGAWRELGGGYLSGIRWDFGRNVLRNTWEKFAKIRFFGERTKRRVYPSADFRKMSLLNINEEM